MDVQTALTLLIETISVGFTALLLIDFIAGLNTLLQQSQEDHQNQVQLLEDVPETSMQKSLEEPPVGWSVVEPTTEWHGWSCFLPMDTAYWRKADALQRESIRTLKKLASEKKIKGYSSLVKAQLIAALLAS
jgi:hypothetical protein